MTRVDQSQSVWILVSTECVPVSLHIEPSLCPWGQAMSSVTQHIFSEGFYGWTLVSFHTARIKSISIAEVSKHTVTTQIKTDLICFLSLKWPQQLALCQSCVGAAFL